MRITEEQRKKLLSLNIGRDILAQICEETYIHEDLEMEIKINGVLVKDPFRLIEEYNKLLEKSINNFENEVKEYAKKMIIEKYDDIYQESFELTRELEKLKDDISSRINY